MRGSASALVAPSPDPRSRWEEAKGDSNDKKLPEDAGAEPPALLVSQTPELSGGEASNWLRRERGSLTPATCRKSWEIGTVCLGCSAAAEREKRHGLRGQGGLMTMLLPESPPSSAHLIMLPHVTSFNTHNKPTKKVLRLPPLDSQGN